MAYKPLDESLITSDVCIRCGFCCKWTSTTQLANGIGEEWMDVMIGTNPNARMVKHNKRDVDVMGKGLGRNVTPFEIEFTCPQLKTNDEGHKLCSIYMDRPKVCSSYSCFEASNKGKRRPQGWDRITKAIKEVHGIDVTYDNEMKVNPGSQIKKGLEMIGVREIK